MSGFATHEVLNQSGELIDFNAFTSDAALVDAVNVFGGSWATDRLERCGARVGSAHVQALARLANRHVPELRTHDRFGNRLDDVEFHPAWHELMGMFRADEVHSLGWTAPRPGAHVARAALSYLWAQGEAGVGCPGVMTFASIAALRHQPDVLGKYRNKILSASYDPRPLPPAAKKSLSVAMAMTEKQGGSDLRQTQTTAVPAGGVYHLTGHKWFFSAPTSDLFLTLARTDAGVSCFLAQGWLDDGSRNRLLLQRLKDKCGNRSNASGIATILEMAHLTRVECALGSAALMRQAVTQAIHHASHRTAFQRRLIDQPAMENVLADLAVESEAAMWLAMRAAAALDASPQDEAERLLNRVIAPLAKFFICKRASAVAAEAMECHGGNGFIEEHVLARLYRDAPLNGLWEGSGNIICLDFLRALSREPEAKHALHAEIGRAKGQHMVMDNWLRRAAPEPSEATARHIVEHYAIGLAASLLLRHAPPALADAFCRTRLAGACGLSFGTLPEDINRADIVLRAAAQLR